MKINKKVILTFFLFVFFCANNVLYGQIKENKQTNAEYVMDIIQISSTKSVSIISINITKEYDGEWLSNVTVNGEYITFKRGERTHIWNLKNLIFIDINADVIKIRLNETTKG